jgi:hypothetical protein
MATLDEKAISAFRRRVSDLLLLRYALAALTVWALAWGVFVLVLRAALRLPRVDLLWGLAGIVPALVVAFILSRRYVPASRSVRALLDGHSRCGGLVMAAAETDIGPWRARMRPLVEPGVRWHGRRAWMLLGAAVCFVLFAFLIPQRLAALSPPRQLEIDEEIGRLAEQINVLEKEKVIEPDEAKALMAKLEQIREEAVGRDPVKTWEAIDLLSEKPAQAAQEAAEAAVQKTEQLTKAETLASGLAECCAKSGSGDSVKRGDDGEAESGEEGNEDSGGSMSAELMTDAMNELAKMVEDAAAQDEEFKRQLERKGMQKLSESPELTKEQLEQLADMLSKRKGDLSNQLQNLCDAGMISPEMMDMLGDLSQCDTKGLDEFLAENAGDMSVADMMDRWCQGGEPGRGGVDRGRGDAPMTWGDESSKEGTEFKEVVLPPADLAALKESRITGVSRNAPTGEDGGPSASGALSGSTAGGGSAHTQTVLPRHRGAVKRYFERE